MSNSDFTPTATATPTATSTLVRGNLQITESYADVWCAAPAKERLP
jgi:hypothetical protein